MEPVFFPIELEVPVCIEGLSEDAVRELVAALRVRIQSDIAGWVKAPAAYRVEYKFDGAGNFSEVEATIEGTPVTLFGKELGLFDGPPTASNPGRGWMIDSALTKKFFPQQSLLESEWELFIARRAPILNVVSS